MVSPACQDAAPGLQVGAGGVEAGEVGAGAVEAGGFFFRQLQALHGQLHGRLHYILPGQLAQLLVQLPHAGHGARYAGCPVAERAQVGYYVAGRIEVHVAGGGGGGRFAEVESSFLLIGPAVE